MAIVLDQYTTEKQRSVLLLLWVKGLRAKNIHKEILPLYGGKCLSRKAFGSWLEKFSQEGSQTTYDARPVGGSG
jgi:hypothetical protein